MVESLESRVATLEQAVYEMQCKMAGLNMMDDPEEKMVFQRIKDAWNRNAIDCEVNQINGITPQRAAILRRLLQDAGWLEQYEYSLECIKQSSFLRGKSLPRAGQKAFRVTFDWLIKPDNMTKIIEHKYTDEEDSSHGYGNDDALS